MTVGLLTRLTLLAAEATASGSFFDQMASRFRAGKGGMYPIAVCAVIALAIIVERVHRAVLLRAPSTRTASCAA